MFRVVSDDDGIKEGPEDGRADGFEDVVYGGSSK